MEAPKCNCGFVYFSFSPTGLLFTYFKALLSVVFPSYCTFLPGDPFIIIPETKSFRFPFAENIFMWFHLMGHSQLR